MSSKVNEALFDLIQSMSKSEKRYFKLMSSRHTIGDENNYVRLFDFLDHQQEYDEEGVEIHFKGEAFLNRFSITKKRLYDHILTALDSFHASGSVEAQLYKMLHSADILFEKSLYDQSRRVLRSAEKLASKFEKQAILLLVANKQRRLLETSGYLEVDAGHISELDQKERAALESIDLYNRIWTVKSRLFAQLSRKGIARSSGETHAYTEICAEIMDGVQLEKVSTECNYLFHHTLSAYYYSIGDTRNSLFHLHKNLDLFETEAGQQMIEPNKQVSAYTNAIYVSDKLGLQKDSLLYLGKLKKMAASIECNEDLSIKLFSSISSIEFSLCLRRGDFDSARKIAHDVEQRLAEFGDKIVPARRAFLEFKLAVAFLGTAEYSAALKWVNRILNSPELDKTEDIIGFTQLLDLLIHIEMKHDDLLPYALKSAQRFFKTRNRLYGFEKLFLQFVGKLIKCQDRFEVSELWDELCTNLATVNSDEYESVAQEYFDFSAWAESRARQKSFDAVVREKYFEFSARAAC